MLPKSNISKSLVLTAIPFAGYVFAYAYSYGYLSYFGLQSSFITIGLEQVITAITVTAGYMIFIYSIYQIATFFIVLLDRKDPIQRAIWRIAVLALGFLPIYSVLSTSSLLKNTLGFSLLLLTYVFLEFGWPLLFEKGNTYRDKVAATQKRDDSIVGLDDMLVRSPLRSVWFFILFVVVMSYYAYLAGTKKAATQEQFLVLEQSGQKYVYVQDGVFVGVNESEHTVSGDVIIFSNSEKLSLKREKIGKLTLSK